MSVFLDDGDVRLYHGDVIQTLRELPAGIAQTCITSPPYWGLRDYAADGQLGLEATPDLYVERLVAVFREVWRVLRDDGTVWLNLGDSYCNAGSSRNGEGLDGARRGGASGADGALGYRRRDLRHSLDGIKHKDLVGIPWRVAFALQADGWYLRSDIVWSKPNPMPESVVDRPTKAHEYLFLLSKRPRYFYDSDAIREPHTDPSRGNGSAESANPHTRSGFVEGTTWVPSVREYNPAGRNRRSVWTIPTEPFPEAHFATYPQALVRPCIQAGTSERGECVRCGAPWVRLTDRVGGDTEFHERPKRAEYGGASTSTLSLSGNGSREWAERGSRRESTGWSPSCSCQQGGAPGQVWDVGGGPKPTWPQTVLDPFIGSGTTALVARNHGRRCIGIDLSAEYLAIAAKRLQQLSLLAGADSG